MARKQKESRSTRDTVKASVEDEEDEEGSGRQSHVLLCPASKGSSATSSPNRKHRQTASRVKEDEEEEGLPVVGGGDTARPE